VATSLGRIVKSGKDTNAQAVCELEPDERSVPAAFAQRMNCMVACVAPMMIARIIRIRLALIFIDHFPFELAGVDDDGAGSVAVVDKYHGTLKDGLRGFFARGGGGPGLPNPLS
jgi:hypothetical protein